MAKIVNILEYFNQQELFFSPKLESEAYLKAFKDSELGRLYESIPWAKVIKFFFPTKRRGRRYKFPEQAQIALMILKSYTCLSDKQLMERCQSDIFFQIFCGVRLVPNKKYNYKIISEIRVRLSKRLNNNEQIAKLQELLSDHWRVFIDYHQADKRLLLMDATCYESSVRYPTDWKLLYESVEFIHEIVLKALSKLTEEKIIVDNYYKVKKDYKFFSRKRRKTYKEKRKIIKRLLRLLSTQLSKVSTYEDMLSELLSPLRYQKYQTVKEVYREQVLVYEGEKVSDRIISLSKPYLRPIKRGKEVKPVEFGAKAHLVHIAGLDFIEYISFKPFNESKRFISAIETAQRLVGVPKIVAADKIYGTNKNRRYCTSNNLLTNFVRKGKAGKNEQAKSIIRREASKLRASRIEGSFGVQKQYYNLGKIKARKSETEILWIVFGIVTKNAVEIGRRMRQMAENQLNTV